MLIYPVEISQTAVSGIWSVNTKKFDSAILKQIVLEATTATSWFDFSITDDRGLTVYKTTSKALGKLRVEVNIPLKGIYTLAVANARRDEAYTGRLMIQEGY